MKNMHRYLQVFDGVNAHGVFSVFAHPYDQDTIMCLLVLGGWQWDYPGANTFSLKSSNFFESHHHHHHHP